VHEYFCDKCSMI